VLPLDTPAFARAAAAVRDGFLAAAQAANAADRCVVLPHARDGVIGAFDAARERGALVIVGPLIRDDLKTVALANGQWPTTVALNQLDDGTPLPPNVYSLSLAVESDAHVLAQRAQSDGVRSLAVVEGDTPLDHRLAVAFATDWVATGAAAPTSYVLDPAPASLGELRKSLGRDAPDAALLALDASHAALVKPFMGLVPGYASGLLFDRPGPAAARDLEGVRVTEIPYILTPEAPDITGLPRASFETDAETRLYALGLDAFRIARAFVDGAPAHLSVDGAIGHLVLGPERQFERTPLIGVYREGRLVPLDDVAR
jgi:outer membrane PBP1 activator LpoA protein